MKIGLVFAAVALLWMPVHAQKMVRRKKPRDLEKAQLAKYPQVTRDGTSLSIKTPQRTVTIKDNMHDGEGSAQYNLVGAIAPASGRTDFLIEGRYWEGYGYILVNGETGAQVSLPEKPELSPNRNKYLSASMDLEQFARPNRILIIAARDFKTELKLDFKQRSGHHSGPEDAKWISDKEISFLERTVAQPGTAGKSKPMVLKYANDTWTASEK